MTNASIRVRDATTADRPAVVEVFATGMVDNPLHVAAYGPDAQRRVRAHRLLVAAGLDALEGLDLLCLELDGRVVGAAGIARPGACRPTARQRVAIVPTLAVLGPTTARRVARWLSAWAERDPHRPHCHVGPVAVRSERQGQGLGTRLMGEVVDRLDRSGATGYLETDRSQNVSFYQRLGFEVVDRADVLGVPNWFMSRDPRPHRGEGDLG